MTIYIRLLLSYSQPPYLNIYSLSQHFHDNGLSIIPGIPIMDLQTSPFKLRWLRLPNYLEKNQSFTKQETRPSRTIQAGNINTCEKGAYSEFVRLLHPYRSFQVKTQSPLRFIQESTVRVLVQVCHYPRVDEYLHINQPPLMTTQNAASFGFHLWNFQLTRDRAYHH